MKVIRRFFIQSSDSRLRWSLFCLLLSAYLLIYIDKPDSLDGEALLAVSAALVRTGSADMNSIAYTDWIMPAGSGMGRTGTDGATYSKKGIIPSLALAPFVIASDTASWLTTRATAMLFNPLVTAATAAILYTLIRRLKYAAHTAFVVCLIYGGATFALVYAKTLSGEPLTALLLVIAALHTHRFWDKARALDVLIIGMCVSGLIGINAVYTLYAPIFGVAILIKLPVQFRRALIIALWYAAPIVAAITLLALFNITRFGDPLQGGYRFEDGEGFIHPITTGLYGLFLSPYRGVFWYNPILFLALPGAFMLFRATGTRRVTVLFLTLIAAQALMFAAWWSWHGGIVWGARFLIPVLPLMTLLIAPLVQSAWGRRWFFVSIGVIVVISVGVQVLGALISYLPHNTYLFAHFFTGDFAAPVTLLDTRVLVDPALSPIIGHLALLLSGWQLDPVALYDADIVHVLLVSAVFIVGILLALRPRLNILIPIVIIIIALNGIGARRATMPEAQRIRVLNDVMQPPGTILAATTAYGAGLIDLETRQNVITLNAPLEYQDQRALTLRTYALRHYDRLWLMTWYPPAMPENWIERDLWSDAYFGGESAIDGHRVLLFQPAPMPMPLTTTSFDEYRFGAIQLTALCSRITDNGIFIDLGWQTSAPLATDYQWFVHMIDADGAILAQHDRQPNGGYNPTSAWIPFEQTRDRLYFSNAPTAADLRIGWIDPTDGARLAVRRDGQPTDDTFIVLPLDTCDYYE